MNGDHFGGEPQEPVCLSSGVRGYSRQAPVGNQNGAIRSSGFGLKYSVAFSAQLPAQSQIASSHRFEQPLKNYSAVRAGKPYVMDTSAIGRATSTSATRKPRKNLKDLGVGLTLGIPAKLNAHSEWNPNGIPG
jgi:hypothetical protein